MVDIRISQMPESSGLEDSDIIEVSKLSDTVTITAATISAQASDNSYNDSGDGFLVAGFALADQVRVQGFTGSTVNNIFTGSVTEITAGKMTIGGTEGDVIVDDAAGESVTISKYVTNRSFAKDTTLAYHYSSSIGTPPSGTGNNSLSIGDDARTGASNSSVAIGTSARADSTESVSIGSNSYVDGNFGVSVGPYAESDGSCVAVGDGARALVDSVAIGSSSSSDGSGGVAIGTTAVADADDSTAVGSACDVRGARSTGLGAHVNLSGGAIGAIGISGAPITITHDGSILMSTNSAVTETSTAVNTLRMVLEGGADLKFSGGNLTLHDGTNDTWKNPVRARKTASESRASTVTPAVDSDMILALEANTLYKFTAFLKFDVGNGGARIEWILPAGATIDYEATYGTGVGASEQLRTVGSGATTGPVTMPFAFSLNPCVITGNILTSGTPGNVQLQWAQQVSDVANTTLEINSRMEVEYLNN